MRHPFLKIVNYNWGKTCPGEWDKTTWKKNFDGSFFRTDKYRPEWKEKARYVRLYGQVTQSDIEKMRKIVNNPLPDTHLDASDGDAWEITVYSEDGRITQTVDCGYVYGIDTLEKLLELMP